MCFAMYDQTGSYNYVKVLFFWPQKFICRIFISVQHMERLANGTWSYEKGQLRKNCPFPWIYSDTMSFVWIPCLMERAREKRLSTKKDHGVESMNVMGSGSSEPSHDVSKKMVTAGAAGWAIKHPVPCCQKTKEIMRSRSTEVGL